MTFVLFDPRNVKWLGEMPAIYDSSPGVERGFCPTCGSTLTFARPDRDEMSVLAGSLDNPSVARPSEHIFVEQCCAWLQVADGLPAHDRFPPGYEDREAGKEEHAPNLGVHEGLGVA
jgi:hypothetical protein